MPIRHVASGLALIIVLAASAPAQTVLYVDARLPIDGQGDGWDDAHHFSQDALSRAAPGNEIRVAAGTHRSDERSAIPAGDGSLVRNLADVRLASPLDGLAERLDDSWWSDWLRRPRRACLAAGRRHRVNDLGS